MRIGKIEKDVPAPKPSNRKAIQLVLGSMEVGDSVYIEANSKEINNIRSSTLYKMGSMFKSKSEGKGIRIWKVKEG